MGNVGTWNKRRDISGSANQWQSLICKQSKMTPIVLEQWIASHHLVPTLPTVQLWRWVTSLEAVYQEASRVEEEVEKSMFLSFLCLMHRIVPRTGMTIELYCGWRHPVWHWWRTKAAAASLMTAAFITYSVLTGLEDSTMKLICKDFSLV